jgi:hypothetical protein
MTESQEVPDSQGTISGGDVRVHVEPYEEDFKAAAWVATKT